MRIRRVLGCLVVASLSCGCAARLPVHHAEAAALADAAAPPTTCYQRVAEEIRATPGGYGLAHERDDFEHHKLNVFLGYTGERGGGGATIGLDYEWRISELVGVEAFFDHVFGEVDAYAFGGLVAFHPWKGLVAFAGPGVDLDVEDAERGGTELEASFLFRVGVAYEFELGKGWSIGPGAIWDIVVPKDSAWIVGLNIGKAW